MTIVKFSWINLKSIFEKKYYEFYSGSSFAFEVRQGLFFFNFQKLKRHDFRKKYVQNASGYGIISKDNTLLMYKPSRFSYLF